MKRVIAALLLLPAVVLGQPVSQLPDVGKWIARSRDAAGLSTGCVLTYDKTAQLLRCLDPRLVSLSFPPSSFGLGTGTPPTLVNGDPPYLTFTEAGNQVASLDFTMPSATLDGSSLSIEWTAAASSGTVVWQVDWCRYALGQTPCVPDGTNMQTLTTTTQGATLRTDSTLNPFDPTWLPSDHIVLHVTRASSGTLSGNLEFRGMRMEFTQ